MFSEKKGRVKTKKEEEARNISVKENIGPTVLLLNLQFTHVHVAYKLFC